jgi:flagellin-specific chaperone FliS
MQTLTEVLCELKNAIATADIEEAENLINKALDILG